MEETDEQRHRREEQELQAEGIVAHFSGSRPKVFRHFLEPGGGAPVVIGDKLPKVFDNAAGRVFTSRSERKRVYKELGLRRISVGEAVDKGIMGDHKCMSRYVTYGGKRNLESSAERRPNNK